MGDTPASVVVRLLQEVVAPVHEEVLAACASSKIPQLYATSQEVVMVPGSQDLPRCGKSQLEQSVMQDRV